MPVFLQDSPALLFHPRAPDLCDTAHSTSAPIKHVATIEIVSPEENGEA